VAGRFETTRWSLVLAARGEPGVRSREALQALCQSYWEPLYAHVRRWTSTPEEAEDLTQGFFVQLLERDDLASVSPDKGRLRSFLLACLKHFLSHEWDRARAQKRGADRIVSLDTASAEARYRREPRHSETPDQLFERKWALQVLEQARSALRQEMATEGNADRLAVLEPFLTGDRPARTYRAVGEELRLSEGAVKVAVHRLRKRFGELLRSEVAETVATAGAVEDELRHLLTVLGGTPQT